MNRNGVFSFLLLLLLAACGESHEQMLRQLEELERMNRAYEMLTNDTLAKDLADYFDRRGTPNERMRAHYILGRTYADMGEAPAALNAYLNAAEAADTTVTVCDYHTLSRVYGQMSDVFYYQCLFDDFITAIDHSIYFAWKDNDTLQALNSLAHKLLAYHQRQKTDSVIILFDDLYERFLQYRGLKAVSRYCSLPVSSLIKKGETGKAKYYIDLYESESGYFDSLRNIKDGMEAYYYYKGDYYMACMEYDSAEYYFRKELSYGKDAMNQNMAARGLSLLFSQTHQMDSAAKYALYSYEMNDSVYAQMTSKEVEQMHSFYNYSRYKEEARRKNEIAARKSRQVLELSVVSLIIVLAFALTVYFWWKRKRNSEREHAKVVADLKSAQAELQALYKAENEVKTLRKREESFIEMINRQNTEIDKKREEVTDLQKIEKDYIRRIHEQENLVTYLKTIVQEFQGRNTKPRDDAYELLGNLPQYKLLFIKIKNARTLTDSEWILLDTFFNYNLPEFHQFLSNTHYARNKKYRACMLFRLNLSAKHIAAMLGVTISNVSKMSTKILAECFNSNGSGKELKKKLSIFT